MPENNEPTIESLQAQILEMNTAISNSKAEFDKLKAEKEKTDKALAEAREINSKLWLRGESQSTVTGIENEGEEPETVEQFIDSFIKPNLVRMRETTGIKNLGSEMFGNEN